VINSFITFQKIVRRLQLSFRLCTGACNIYVRLCFCDTCLIINCIRSSYLILSANIIGFRSVCSSVVRLLRLAYFDCLQYLYNIFIVKHEIYTNGI
jgi:hypothetical protein